jgi:hypothetical protein
VKADGTCQVRRCRQHFALIWYDRPVCWKHWCRHCSDTDRFSLFREFGIKEGGGVGTGKGELLLGG